MLSMQAKKHSVASIEGPRDARADYFREKAIDQRKRISKTCCEMAISYSFPATVTCSSYVHGIRT